MLAQHPFQRALRNVEQEGVRGLQIVVGDVQEAVVAMINVDAVALRSGAIASSRMPMSSSISNDRACTVVAFDRGVGPSALSTIRQVVPCRISSAARISPVGPAPISRTGRSGCASLTIAVSKTIPAQRLLSLRENKCEKIYACNPMERHYTSIGLLFTKSKEENKRAQQVLCPKFAPSRNRICAFASGGQRSIR